jgi:hypothetical protein
VRHPALPTVPATALQSASPAVLAATQQQAGLQAVASGTPSVLLAGSQQAQQAAAEQQPRDEMLEREKAELEAMEVHPPDNGQFVLDLDVLRARITQVRPGRCWPVLMVASAAGGAPAGAAVPRSCEATASHAA